MDDDLKEVMEQIAYIQHSMIQAAKSLDKDYYDTLEREDSLRILYKNLTEKTNG